MIVIEIQKNGESVVVLPTFYTPDINVANQKYHQILSAAAVSTVEVHSAVMLNDDGGFVKCEKFTHIGGDDDN